MLCLWLPTTNSFDLWLEEFGVDTTELKQPANTRIFQAWLEDWENEILKKNDCVAEGKYKDLVFYDMDNKVTFVVWNKNVEYRRASRKLVGEGGWALIYVTPNADKNSNGEAWTICEETIAMIATTEQAPGVEIICRRESESEESKEEE